MRAADDVWRRCWEAGHPYARGLCVVPCFLRARAHVVIPATPELPLSLPPLPPLSTLSSLPS